MLDVPTSDAIAHGPSLVWAARTDVGKVRKLNEDSLLARPGMFVVADGMGGHEAGDVASRLTIEVCSELVDQLPLQLADVEDLVRVANSRVQAHSATSGAQTMGTTLVAAVLFDNGGEAELMVVNVGDSRCYTWTEADGLNVLTTDHSVVQELVDAGQIAERDRETHPERNVVTRAIGIDPSVAADFVVVPRTPDLRLLLCSDGVCGQVDSTQIERVLATNNAPQEAVDALIDLVLEGRAPDNATAIVIDVEWHDANGCVAEADDVDITGPRPQSVLSAPATEPIDSRFLIDTVPPGQVTKHAEDDSAPDSDRAVPPIVEVPSS